MSPNRAWCVPVLGALLVSIAIAHAQPASPVGDPDGSNSPTVSVGGGSSVVAGDSGGSGSDDARPAASGSASDDFIDPSQLPAVSNEPPPAPLLPRALVRRTLLLPPRVAEGSIETGLGRQTFGHVSLTYGALGGTGHVGLEHGEIFVECELVPYDNGGSNGIDVPVLQRLAAGAVLRLADDTGLGARYTAIGLSSDLSGYTPSVFVEHKFRPSPVAAIVVSGGAQYSDQNVPIATGYVEETRSVAAVAGGAVELQASPMVALEAVGTMAQGWFLEEGHPGSRSAQAYSYGADVTVSVADHVDLVPFFSAVPVAARDSLLVGLQLRGH